jgi:hypothetical protein
MTLPWQTRRLTAWLACCAIATTAASASAQPPAFAALTFTASVDKKVYALGEPVYLSVFLHNTSGSTQLVAPALRTSDGTIEVVVVDASGRPRGFTPTSIFDTSAPSAKLPPKQVLANVVPIFFGASGWTFPAAGTYTVRTTYTFTREGKHLHIPAAPSTFEVRADQAGELLVQPASQASEQAGKLLLWMSGDHLTEGGALLESVIGKHPPSPLASYAALALGRRSARHFLDYRTGKVRPPDPERARSYLRSVRTNDLPVYPRTLHQLAQAQASAELGDQQSARTQLAGAAAVIAERPELARLTEVAARMRTAIK